jgi:4,5-dihydroxyphthalate decarboxylase
MSALPLSLACGPYDRTQALRDGTVRPQGIDLTYISGQPAELFWRMLQYKEFEVSEMSMSNYISLVGKGDCPFIAIPAFLSRVFRHGYIFVYANSGIEGPNDLRGKRGGVPEYSQTAAVMARGVLEHEYGIRPNQIEWIQSRRDRMHLTLPGDVRVTPAPDGRELSDMLECGEIDFLITGNNPLCFRRGSPNVRRLFPNYRELERDYYRRTKIYPIMHTVVIRRDIYDQHPWVALSMYNAFCAAKDLCCRLLLETGSPKATFGWLQAMIEEEQAVFGTDWYPYGIEANRPSLEALLQYNFEQGLTPRRLAVEELFASSTYQPIPLGEGQFVQ